MRHNTTHLIFHFLIENDDINPDTYQQKPIEKFGVWTAAFVASF